ncbi:tyrosine-type recombinase/integrase [Spirosoma sp. HMF3257]|uniref:Tyr recombinase domain-containing protein n=1 Tax=Spirosoma telluris TaxID=2183553 RepID=A0A327NDY9_9BACT|nr:tyrosine-type recombinase/integrase [Spirosoma telluris]RAI73322.1 hypothetical protein HMF3257_00700 [Spirosoma telluris]
MPQLTFNVELSSKPNRIGLWTVMVRLYVKDQLPSRIPTSVKAVNLLKYWHPKKFGKWVKGHPDAKALNTEIEDEFKRIKAQVKAWQDAEPNYILTPKQLAERFKGGSSERFFHWVDRVLEDAKQQSYSSYINKKSSISAYRKWAGEDIPLRSISPYQVRQFRDYLQKSNKDFTNGRRKPSTINKILDRMHRIHQDVLIKMGQSPKQAALNSPWNDLAALTESKSKKLKLNQVGVDQVSMVKVEKARLKLSPEKAFEVWMLSRALAGARHSDMMLLRYQNFKLNEDGHPVHLRYEMHKTGGIINIPVLGEAKLLLKAWWNPKAKPSDFLLPFLKNSAPYAKIVTHEDYKLASFDMKRQLFNALNYWNRRINLSLELLGEDANLNGPLRMHSARHSFADLARRIMHEDKTITMYDIQLMLGHSSIQVTEIYTKSLEEPDNTEAMQAIFNRKKRLDY